MALDLNSMPLDIFDNEIVFTIRTLLNTCKLGTLVNKVTLFKYSDKRLCLYSTQEEFLRRTNDNQKSLALFVTYKTLLPLVTCTLVRWL